MMSLNHRHMAAILLLGSAALLSGCAAVVVGGAAATGGMVATDRRSSGTQVADKSIGLQASSRVNDVLGAERGNIGVTSYNRKVLLTGAVRSADERSRVEAAVAKVPDVIGVINKLIVGPEATLSQRSGDAITTSRVKTGLIAAKGVPSTSIKVLTDRGTTYLMGRLTQNESDAATEVARTTPGVQRVVRVIDIISDAEALHPTDSGIKPMRPQEPAPVSSVNPASAGNSSSGTKAVIAPTPTVTTHPVLAPAMENVQPIEVRTLPPAR